MSINSLTPLLAKLLASTTISSIFLDTWIPRMSGMAQKEQVRLQPSAILR